MSSMIVNRASGRQYSWGKRSEGWHLLDREDLSVILEEMPAGESDDRHYHDRSRQFFFVLSGAASLDAGGPTLVLHPGDGAEVAPRCVHRISNAGLTPVQFLVISMPKSHGDRMLPQDTPTETGNPGMRNPPQPER